MRFDRLYGKKLAALSISALLLATSFGAGAAAAGPSAAVGGAVPGLLRGSFAAASPSAKVTAAAGASAFGAAADQASAPHSLAAATTAQPLSYADADSIAAWAVEAVAEASALAFIDGSGGRFYPQSAVTRAEFSKMLVTVRGLNGQPGGAARFNDVAPSDWFSPYVNAVYEAGYISGLGSGKFGPSEKLTREQMAVILAKAWGIPQAAGSAAAIRDFEQVSEWAKREVQTVVGLGLMSGWGDGFQPQDEVTREMAAVVLIRTYHSQNDKQPSARQPDLKQAAVERQIGETAAFLLRTVASPAVDSLGGDWTVLGLARSGVPVPDAYYAGYYANVEKTLKEKGGKLHAVKYTEYDRVILGLTAIGRGVEQVAGYDLRERLADYNTVIKQGINGPIFALIALDSKGYAIPNGQAVKVQTTRERLVEFILQREIDGGGWALGDKAAEPDPDITAMAIQSLTPYYKTNKLVQAAVDRALVWLSQTQTPDGGFASWQSANAESAAQVIVALAGLGIQPHTDPRFVKNGRSAIDALLSYADPGGGFYHIKPGGVDNGGGKPGEVDPMATDQAMYALVAYNRLIKGQTRLYDMTDVK